MSSYFLNAISKRIFTLVMRMMFKKKVFSIWNSKKGSWTLIVC